MANWEKFSSFLGAFLPLGAVLYALFLYYRPEFKGWRRWSVAYLLLVLGYICLLITQGTTEATLVIASVGIFVLATNVLCWWLNKRGIAKR